jgi:hypothetical protein
VAEFREPAQRRARAGRQGHPVHAAGG